jgi:hypothetical protein
MSCSLAASLGAEGDEKMVVDRLHFFLFCMLEFRVGIISSHIAMWRRWILFIHHIIL